MSIRRVVRNVAVTSALALFVLLVPADAKADTQCSSTTTTTTYYVFGYAVYSTTTSSTTCWTVGGGPCPQNQYCDNAGNVY